MAITVKLTGDLSDLEAKLKSGGVKVESFGDDAEAAGKQASQAFGSDLEGKIQRIEEATKRSADATETLASHAGGMNALAEGFGNTERLALGMNDIMGVAAEQFGVNLGPAQEYAQAIGDVAGGLEGVIGGGVALVQQLGPMVTGMVPMIASTWAHVTALWAQAAATIAANLPLIAIIATFALLAAGVVLVVKHWDEIVEKFPILGTIVDGIKTKLGEFTDWITGTFVPGVASLYDPAIKVPLDLIVSFFKMQFDLVKVGIETALGVIKGIVDIFMGVFTGDWDRAWAGVKAVVDSLWEGIKGAFGIGLAFLTDELVPKMLSAGKALGGALMDGLKDALSSIAGFAGGVADAVLSAVRGVVNNFIIDPINRSLEFGFDTKIPGVGKININPPDLPRLASGMWDVPGPTGVDQFPALLAGGEMVVPAGPAEDIRNQIRFGAARDGVAGDTTKAQADLNALLALLRKLDQVSQDMWLADPKNAEFLANLRRAAAGLDPITPSIGDGPVYSPGSEGGARLGGLPTPRVGGSAGVGSGGGAPAVTAGGGVKADEALIERLDKIVRNGDQSVELGKAMLAIMRSPQVIEFMLKTDPKAFANMLAPFIVDPLAQISRRQTSWSPS